MSRYIDVNAFYDKMYEWVRMHGGIIRNEMQAILEATPSIDIVRCKECKHNYNTAINHGKMKPRCDFTDRKLTENDFCSRGEREGE